MFVEKANARFYVNNAQLAIKILAILTLEQR
jgi:hypothetical protein